MAHLGAEVDAGCRVVTVQVKVHYHCRGQARVQLSPAESQPAQEAQYHQHGAIEGEERGRHHGIPPPVTHHPNDAGPYKQGESQPVVVGDAPYLNVNTYTGNSGISS